ncbi:chromobox protein homolog 1-like [Planococcus citri]|uniref:chromobox protein homolog 1-like n=1 Tax=Planococcus citri TaxID=170843 RepID=UPI0031F7C9E2
MESSIRNTEINMNGQSHEETYIVEKIVKKRIRKGQEQYLVKWLGYPSSKNTWEPRSHLAECKYLIAQLESRKKTPSKRRSKASKGSTSRTSDINASLTKSKNVADVELNESTSNGIRGRRSKKINSEKTAFARNLKPLEIVGYVECDGEHYFLIKWDSGKIGMVPNNDARKFCPQLVIKFYESKISFQPAIQNNLSRRFENSSD